MIAFMVFTQKDDENICNNIYSEEDGELFNYFIDEDYIVKTEEPKYKNVKELELAILDKDKSKKGKSKDKKSQLIKKEFHDIRQALYFLGGNLDDFKQGIQAHKKLPQIINPYDMDFEEGDSDLNSIEVDIDDKEFDEDKLFDELKDLQDDEEDKDLDEPDDDDFYK
jgi:hypothetical protein